MSIIDLFKRYFSEKRASAARQRGPDLGLLTVVKLKAVAKKRGLKGYSKLNKAELIKLLS